jgi:hypothetical protein
MLLSEGVKIFMEKMEEPDYDATAEIERLLPLIQAQHRKDFPNESKEEDRRHTGVVVRTFLALLANQVKQTARELGRALKECEKK